MREHFDKLPAFKASSNVDRGTGFTFLGFSVEPNFVPKVSKCCLYSTAGSVVTVFAKTVAGMTVHARTHNINSLLLAIVQISLFSLVIIFPLSFTYLVKRILYLFCHQLLIINSQLSTIWELINTAFIICLFFGSCFGPMIRPRVIFIRHDPFTFITLLF